MRIALLMLCLAAFPLCGTIGFAQGADNPPGGIKLLPGYIHQPLRGIDTRVGKISREAGLTIQYDIGKLAGNYADAQKGDAAWFKVQVINGQTVHVAYGKDKTLYVTFINGPANFFVKVATEEEMADVLLMLATYSPSGK